MSWLPILAASLSYGVLPGLVATSNISPVGSAASDILTYILGFGPLGVGVVLYTLRVIVPGKAVDEAREQARTDLIEENRRLVAEKDAAVRKADDALKFAQDQLVPLLLAFNASVSSLLPVLQRLAAYQEDRPATRRRGRDDP